MRTRIMVVGIAAALLGGSAPRTAHAVPPCIKAGEHVVRMDDRRTTAEVERRIAADESVAPLSQRVSVSTVEGVVTLRGVVASDEDRMVLASLAESAPGVRHVDDRLEVASWRKLPSASRAR